MLAAQARERRGRGPHDAADALCVRRVERATQLGGGYLCALPVRTVHQQTAERDERRVAQIFAVADLFGVEAVVVLRAGVAQGVVVRVESLDEDAPRARAASRASRDLREQLKGALGRTEVGHA